MPEEKDEARCLLDKALADGVIDRGQYDELVSRSAVKTEIRDRGDLQRGLIASGIGIIVFVVGFFIFVKFHDLSYNAKISLLAFLFAILMAGSLLALLRRRMTLHSAFLSGASNLFVLFYGYWFYYEAVDVSWSNREHIEQAYRNPILAIPLLLIPLIILAYQMHRNSRGGAQLALVSVILGGIFVSARLADYYDMNYYLLGVIGLAVLIFIIIVNIIWAVGRLQKLRDWYLQRQRTIDSLMASGYTLGSIYLIVLFPVMHEDSSGLAIGAMVTAVFAFFTILYSIVTLKKGLFSCACAIVIICTWVFGLAVMGGAAFLVMSVLSGFILIGISMLVRNVPGFRRTGSVRGQPPGNPPPPPPDPKGVQ